MYGINLIHVLKLLWWMVSNVGKCSLNVLWDCWWNGKRITGRSITLKKSKT